MCRLQKLRVAEGNQRSSCLVSGCHCYLSHVHLQSSIIDFERLLGCPIQFKALHSTGIVMPYQIRPANQANISCPEAPGQRSQNPTYVIDMESHFESIVKSVLKKNIVQREREDLRKRCRSLARCCPLFPPQPLRRVRSLESSCSH